MYGSMEESPAAAPALAPAELKAVRKLLSTTSSSIGGSDVKDDGSGEVTAARAHELRGGEHGRLPHEGWCRQPMLRFSMWRGGLRARIYLRRSVQIRFGDDLVDVSRLPPFLRRATFLWQHVLRAVGRMGRRAGGRR